jgi:ATP-dependent DNA helicase 2 subunit 2
VGIETQAEYLVNKRTWTRKIVLITDGESPIEVEDWEATVKKMDSLKVSLAVMYVYSFCLSVCGLMRAPVHRGVNFDDNELPYHEPDKSVIKVSFSLLFCLP